MGHYLKANKSTRTPSTFIFFDTETKPHAIEGKTDRVIHRFHLGYATSFRHVGCEMTRRKHCIIQNPYYFWDWVVSHLTKHRPVWIFAHNVGFDLTTTLAWEMIEQGDFAVERYVSEDPPVICKLRHEKGNLTILDSMNWFRSSLGQIGNDIGLEKIDVDFATCSDHELLNHCKRDVEILEMRIFTLLNWLRQNDHGVMQKTAPGQAFQSYRHRFAPRTEVTRARKQKDGSVSQEQITVCYPLMHDNAEIASRERAAYFGGEARCFWIGRIVDGNNLGPVALTKRGLLPPRHMEGPIYHLDVNSLYPYVMQRYQYPCKWIEKLEGVDCEELSKLLQNYEAIACVKLQTSATTFPVRVEGTPIYAVGNFYTSLCGNELRHALARGLVRKIEYVDLYERMDLFGPYVAHFWGQRLLARAKGDTSSERLIKLMLNSLYGKFGTKAYKWMDRQNVNAKKPWGQWVEDGEVEGSIVRYRAIGWNTQEKQIEGEGKDSFVSIPACVTANARQYMRELRWIAGDLSTLYQHTDSLHVTQFGYDRLMKHGYIDPRELGKLKLVEVITNGEYRGISDQTINGVNRVAGIRSNADNIGPSEFIQQEFQSIARVVASKPADGIQVKTVRVTRQNNTIGGGVDSKGWVKPYLIRG